ncbi:MAG: rhodanese-like domain-containing protein [Epsilonproteobacteria bacterium]|nr:MAG: rhodanese-like domain-containing protein [Campylobacterota bacterium]
MKYLILLLLSFNLFAMDFTKDNLSTVKANFESGKALILDTRSKGEWDKGHVNGAKRYEVSKLKKMGEKIEKNIPKDKIIYTHCMAGYRAKKAAEILKERG